ncbi:MAG: molybdate ABC transporter substrate-binding protein [Desulfovibrio sp.]|nr:molybdate ABC transporter substrate-binding protein [Desulfovibrio sp.]
MQYTKLLVFALFFSLLSLPAGVKAGEMTVSAAASLTNAFNELKTVYEKSHSGLTVFVNYAASNPLLKQIQEGAPVDVFASADQETMDKADAAKVVLPGTRKDFVRNTLVLIVPKGQAKPTKIENLTSFKRIAIGNPDSVPAGRYAKQVFEKASLWDKLQPSFILGTNVRQVLDYVARGEVDCGIVYGTDAKKQADKVDVAMVLQGHKPILYPIAVINTGKNAKEGQAFIDFVLSNEAQAILEKYGFAKP